MAPLRPYQTRGVEKFLATPAPHAMLFAWPMGAGKTAGAIELVRRLQPMRLLIVAPALVRPAWYRQFEAWMPDAIGKIGVITNGKRASNLTKAEKAARDAAFAAPWQIVSYNLLKETENEGWDFIVIDEAHRLRNPISAQSKLVRDRCRCNFAAHLLLLTGTPVPNEVRQLWNPIDMVQPGWFGLPQRNGKEPWRFLQTFCSKVQSEYGIDFKGFNKDKEAYLKSLLSPLMHEVSERDVAPFLPPLFVEPLYVDGGAEMEIVDDWRADLPQEITHYGVFAHLNDTRARVATWLREKGYPVVEIDAAAHDAQSRDMLLQRAKGMPAAIIVSTTHALNEGISLSFLKAGLVLEWTSEMSGMLQFIRRFARQDAVNQMPTYLRFVVRPEDGDRAATLQRRIDDKNKILQKALTDELLSNVTTERSYSDADLEMMAAAALESFRTLEEWQDGEDYESDSNSSEL